MTNDQRAKEIIAGVYDAHNFPMLSHAIRTGSRDMGTINEELIRAIVAALEAEREELSQFEPLARWVANCAGHGINAGMRARGDKLLAYIKATNPARRGYEGELK
jgi:hypothetical protein